MENSSGFSYPTLMPTESTKEYDVREFNLVINFILLLVGVPGNCLIIHVYWAKINKKSTHVLIMSLAWVDLIACVMSVVDIVPQFLHLARIEKPEVFDLLLTIRKMIVSSSVLLTGLIAADRYDCVCRPQSRFFTHGRAKIAAWACLVFAVVVNSPGIIALYSDEQTRQIWISILIVFQTVCFLTSVLTITFCYAQVYRVIKKHVRVSSSCIGVVSSTDSCKHESTTSGITKDKCPALSSDQVSYHNRRKEVVTLIKHRAIESSSEGIQSEKAQERSAVLGPTSQNDSNDKEVATLKKNVDVKSDKCPTIDKKYPTIRRTQSAVLQRKTTKMLFITSLVFLITWLPYWLMIAVFIAHSGGSNISPKTLVIVEELSLTLLINNAVNPFIYGIANRRFRKDCRAALRNIKHC